MTEAAPNAPEQGQAQGQGEPTAWYRNESFGLPAEDIGYIENKGWKESPAAVITAYKNLEKFHGVPADQIIKLPKEGESYDAVWNRLGRPEKVEDYGAPTLPEGVQMDESRVKWADSVMHKVGLTKAQRDALIKETATFEAGAANDYQKAKELKFANELEDLKKEWGSAYEQRSELGRRAVRTFVPGDATQKDAALSAIEDAIGSAALLKLFSNIGEKIGEDKIPVPEGTRPFGYTKEQAQADIQELKTQLGASRERMALYNQGKGPDYEKMMNLLKRAN